MPTVPLRDIVLFPKAIVPHFVGRDTTKRAVERAMAGDKRILAVTQRRAGDDNPTLDDLYGVGVTASVIDLETLDDGTMRLIVKCGHPRVFLVASAPPRCGLRCNCL